MYGETLWLKSTPTLLAIYHQHHCVARHARCFDKGGWRTKQEHLIPKARYYLSRQPQWCLDTAKTIGENCELIIHELINHPTKDLLRQAQGVLAFVDSYGKPTLEAACRYAIDNNSYNYKSLKAILAQGLENQTASHATPDESEREIYQGNSRFQRCAEEFSN